MRDAVFGRQRYWGEPIPIYYKDGIPYGVDERDLPIVLPEVDKYLPTEDGEPPLARAADFNYRGYPLETTTMPGWAGSSWYFLKYMDPHNPNAFAGKDKLAYWKDIDLYMGGSEHGTGHLLYFRFWTKFLKDRGYIDIDEPARKLVNQGMIQGTSALIDRSAIDNDVYYGVDQNGKPEYLGIESYTQGIYVDVSLLNGDTLLLDDLKMYRDDFKNARFYNNKYIALLRRETEKMSKSKYNVVNPDDVIEKYGADCFRMYEMFLGPIEMSKPWDTQGIDGVSRFLRKFWRLFYDENKGWIVNDASPTQTELKTLHKTIKKVEEDVERLSFNTSVSAFMVCVNELTDLQCHKRSILEPLCLVLHAFAPHTTEYLYHKLGHNQTIANGPFPIYDPTVLIENSFEYPVSINGKPRTKMEFALDMPQADIESAVLQNEVVIKWLEGKAPKKIIFVKGRMINIVI
jgi:leucyl-tRNA synthetase